MKLVYCCEFDFLQNGNTVYCDVVSYWSGLVLSPKHLDTVKVKLDIVWQQSSKLYFLFFIFRKHFQCTCKSKKKNKIKKAFVLKCHTKWQNSQSIYMLSEEHEKNVVFKRMRFGIELKLWWCSALMCHRPFKQTPTHTGLSLTKAASTLGAGAVPGNKPPHGSWGSQPAAREGCLRWDKNTGETRGKGAI